MAAFLESKQGHRWDLKRFLIEQAERLNTHARRMADGAGRPFEDLREAGDKDELARALTRQGLRYTKLDNAFLWIEDYPRAQPFADRFVTSSRGSSSTARAPSPRRMCWPSSAASCPAIGSHTA